MRTVENIKAQLRKLKQYKDKTEEELNLIAQEKLDKKDSNFENAEDKKLYNEIYNSYLKEKSFESFTERDTLSAFVYLEVLANRVKTFIDTEANDKNGAVPTQMVDKLLMIIQQIIVLKEQLGIGKKEEVNTNALSNWEALKRKTLAYYKEHGNNVVKCPYCAQLFLIAMSLENKDTISLAAFFKKTILYNEELMKLYDEKRITKEEHAKILGVDDKYVDFMYTGIYLKDKKHIE